MLIHVYTVRVNMEGEYNEWHETLEAEPMDTGWMSRSGTYTLSLSSKDIQCSYIDFGYKATVAVEQEDCGLFDKLRKALWQRVMYDLEEYNKAMLRCLDKLNV